jgi:hypothetical protein
MAGKPTTLGGCELDQTAECPRSRRGGHGRDLGRLDVNYHGWWASGRWFAKSTQGLLGIQDAVAGSGGLWWLRAGGDYCEGVVAMARGGRGARGCEGCTRAICSRMGHREILPTQPCIRRP